MSKNNKDVKRGIVLYIDGKEVKRDVTDIKAEIRKLTKELDRMTIGSKEYNEQMAKIRHLNSIVRDHKGRLREVNEELGKSHFNAGKLADGFNRFGGVILSVIGFLTGFALALRSIREEHNKLESSQAGLKALTGLDDNSIVWLTDQAKTLSTTMTEEGLRVRQSAAEILDAFMLVGSAKPELLGDKEALKQVTEEAMRLQAAAGDITLNEAVDSLTLSLNQYGAAADQASRFVNVLAAGSKEGAVNIASQAKAIQKAGTMAATLNIPIEELVGSIEMLGEKGVKDEIAGTGLKTFFTRLATGATDTNPKVVGLTNALDNLNKQVEAAEAKQAGGGTSLLKKIFGDEGMQVAMILTQNTEKVKEYTAAVTDTNVAHEQATINSATAAAKLDQARNSMKLAAIELGEKLNPAFAVSTNMMTNVVKFLPGLIDWFQKWGGTIVALLIPVAAYIAYLKLAALYHTTLNAITKVATTLKILYAAASVQLAGNMAGANRILTLFSANMVKNATVLRVATAATYLFAAAKAVLTGNIKAARIAMAAFNTVCTKNIYVAIAVAVVALATAIYKLATRTTEAEKAANDYQKRIYTERTELRKLTEAAQRAGDGTQRRKELIDEINSKYGKYLTNLLDEHSTLEDIRQAYQDINVAMQTNIAQKVLDEKTEEISRDMLDKKINRMNKVRNTLSNLFPANLTNDITQKIDKTVNMAVDKGQTAQQVAIALAQKIRRLYGGNKDFEDNLRTGITAYADTVIKEAARINKVKDELAVFVPGVGQTNEIPEVVITGTAPKKKVDGNDGNVDDKKKEKDKFTKVEADYYQRISAIKQKYLADDTMTQEEYSEQMQKAEMQLLNDKLDIAGLEPEKKQEIADKVLDIQIQMKEKRLAIGLTETKEILSAQEKRLQLELESTAKDYKKHLISRESFLEKIKDLQKKYGKSMPELPKVVTEGQQKELEKYLEKLQEIIDKYNEMEKEPKKWNETVQKNWEEINKYTDASSEEMTAIIASLVMDLANLKIDGTESFKSLKDSGEMMFSLLGALGKQFGLAMGEMLAGEEEAVGEFLKSTLNMVLTAIEQLMIAYIAQTTMRNIAEMGVWGLLKAAGEIALITAAFESVKGLVGNFYTGGYTGSGDWDQPQGIVHSNEFVANRYAVANPAVRPVLDLIDSAQRTGSIANLTNDDIAAVVSTRKSPLAIERNIVAGSGQQSADPALLAVLSECGHVMGLLRNRLNEPFITENSVVGRRGIKQAMDKYDSLMKNVSR